VIMVDELVNYQQKSKPGGERYFGNGKPSCHLTTDGDPEELHRFAARLGLRREWAQDPNNLQLLHYDLTPSKRAFALRLGAKYVSGIEQARRRTAKETGQAPPPVVFGEADPRNYELKPLRDRCLTRVADQEAIPE
jgi:hypothetical protein